MDNLGFAMEIHIAKVTKRFEEKGNKEYERHWKELSTEMLGIRAKLSDLRDELQAMGNRQVKRE